LTVGCIGALALSLAACGGGGGGKTPVPVGQNPVPGVTSISPSSATAGSRAINITVTGSNFISGSVVQWGGSARITTFVSSTQLTVAITAADLSNAGTVAVSVFNASPGGGTSNSLSFVVSSLVPLSVVTTQLPNAQHSKLYGYTLEAGGGIPPYSWSVVSGSLPSGLTLSASGAISGTPPSVASDTQVSFTAQVSDFAAQASIITQPLSITVRAAALGRNDTCPTATPLSNGVIRASISPYGDIDVYLFQGTAGQQVTIETYAQRLTIYGDPGSTDIFLDTFLELLDSNCNQLTYNDDIDPGVLLDSLISNYTLPYTGTYYIRVSDLRGDGRPDFIYELHLSGAN
jgi:hypothetical protein